jgi:hypothetical protein
MKKIRYGLIVLWMLTCSATFAAAQVSIGIGFPTVSIGINLPLFPQLVPVPGYPVYYAPRVHGNYFFYDGMYWVYQDDNWYASSWYNGPWGLVEPEVVPLFILRVPVRYYRQPPVYFRGWGSNAPPRWGEHWGHGWEQHRRGWDRWDRRSAPAPAPLPIYQRQYSGDRYPRGEQQHTLRREHYRYQPHDTVVRQHFDQHIDHRASAPDQRVRKEEPPMRSQRHQEYQHSKSLQQGGSGAPPSQSLHRGGEDLHRSTPDKIHPQQKGPVLKDQKLQPGAVEHKQHSPGLQGHEQRSQEKVKSQELKRDSGQGQKNIEERGRERNN